MTYIRTHFYHRSDKESTRQGNGKTEVNWSECCKACNEVRRFCGSVQCENRYFRRVSYRKKMRGTTNSLHLNGKIFSGLSLGISI